MKRERVAYLDTIKGISIILVVFCHNVLLPKETVLGAVLMAMAWAAVPCFFMVTGGLMHRPHRFDWGKLGWRIGKIYLCLCIWKALYLLWFSQLGPVSYSKVQLVKYLFLFGNLEGVKTGHMWFMHAYLAALLFYPVTDYLFSTGRKGRVVLVFTTGVLFFKSIFITASNFLLAIGSAVTGRGQLSISGWDAAMPVGNYSNMVFYFVVGAFLLAYHQEIRAWLGRSVACRLTPLLLIALGTLGLTWVRVFEIGGPEWRWTYLDNGYNRFSTCLLALGLYLLCLQLESWPLWNRVLGYVGQRTMGIFYLHVLLLGLMSALWKDALEPYYSVPANCIKTVVVLGISLVLTNLLRRVPLVRQLVQ